jgi:hypothetical protein
VRAVVYARYGPPNVLRVEEVPTPMLISTKPWHGSPARSVRDGVSTWLHGQPCWAGPERRPDPPACMYPHDVGGRAPSTARSSLWSASALFGRAADDQNDRRPGTQRLSAAGAGDEGRNDVGGVAVDDRTTQGVRRPRRRECEPTAWQVEPWLRSSPRMGDWALVGAVSVAHRAQTDKE